MTAGQQTTLEPLLVGIDEVARLLNCSIRTVHKLNSSGHIPRSAGLTRRLQWSLAELRQWDSMGRPGRERFGAMKGQAK